LSPVDRIYSGQALLGNGKLDCSRRRGFDQFSIAALDSYENCARAKAQGSISVSSIDVVLSANILTGSTQTAPSRRSLDEQRTSFLLQIIVSFFEPKVSYSTARPIYIDHLRIPTVSLVSADSIGHLCTPATGNDISVLSDCE
jgi:hypothetical protein